MHTESNAGPKRSGRGWSPAPAAALALVAVLFLSACEDATGPAGVDSLTVSVNVYVDGRLSGFSVALGPRAEGGNHPTVDAPWGPFIVTEEVVCAQAAVFVSTNAGSDSRFLGTCEPEGVVTFSFQSGG